jgi:uncharacterized protein YjaG (DUF416 family)
MRFDATILRTRLERLAASHRTAFAACCAERMIPSYAAFQRLSSWGDVSTLSTAIQAVWAMLVAGLQDTPEVTVLKERCERVTPHMDDFGDKPFASAALDACVGVLAALECLETGSVDAALEAAVAARDSVDMYIQILERLKPDEPDLEHRIAEHALYVREMKLQGRTLNFLEQVSSFDFATIRRLREVCAARPILDVDPN